MSSLKTVHSNDIIFSVIFTRGTAVYAQQTHRDSPTSVLSADKHFIMASRRSCLLLFSCTLSSCNISVIASSFSDFSIDSKSFISFSTDINSLLWNTLVTHPHKTIKRNILFSSILSCYGWLQQRKLIAATLPAFIDELATTMQCYSSTSSLPSIPLCNNSLYWQTSLCLFLNF